MQMALLCLYMQLLQLLRIAINCCGETELNCSSLRATTTVRDKTVENRCLRGSQLSTAGVGMANCFIGKNTVQSINYYYYFICK